MLCWFVTTGVTVHSRLVEEAAFVLYAPADPLWILHGLSTNHTGNIIYRVLWYGMLMFKYLFILTSLYDILFN